MPSVTSSAFRATKLCCKTLRFVDKLNERIDRIRILKSAEVDILADGSLDYPDELLKELDYTGVLHSFAARSRKTAQATGWARLSISSC
ncbi:MAG: hypothetical protein ACR2JB_16960 [Bryobacteraceae bacterium]